MCLDYARLQGRADINRRKLAGATVSVVHASGKYTATWDSVRCVWMVSGPSGTIACMFTAQSRAALKRDLIYWISN